MEKSTLGYAQDSSPEIKKNPSVDLLLFDLDNTLYPGSGAMDAGITRRLLEFCAQFLGVSVEEAARQRKEMFGVRYHTTLEWLRLEKGLTDIQSLFHYEHPESEKDELDPDPKLRPLLEALKRAGYKLAILTNAPDCHAENVLGFFGIADLFDAITSIESNNLVGKPHREAYLNAITRAGSTLEKTVFFDDMHTYTEGFSAIGGRSVLVSGRYVPPSEISSIHDLPALLPLLRQSAQLAEL